MNLKEKPFYLDDTDVEWVNKTLESLTDDEKIGQLFLPIGYSSDKGYLNHLVELGIGGLFYRPGDAQEVQQAYEYVQKNSKIPTVNRPQI